MSGDSYGYEFQRIYDLADQIRRFSQDPTPDGVNVELRLKFASHLDLVAEAAHDIEWVDSCDYGPGREDAAIERVLGFSFDDYATGCLRTWKPSGSLEKDISHLAFGISEEAGEVAGKFKRAYRDDDGVITPARRQQLIKELGDVLWYLTVMAHKLDYTIGEVAQDNLAKLADREARGVIKGDGDNR